MDKISKTSGLKLKDFKYILFRNVFIFTNGIMFSVVVLLLLFGNLQAGIFLGVISVINISFGLYQDTKAWITLEKLQLLTAPRILKINEDGSSEIILLEQVKKEDIIRLKIGDQIPCDGIVINSQSLEINEGLITGESTSISKINDDHLFAGSIVTSGSGDIKVITNFSGSRIARMTEGIKKYSVNVSPIQHSVNRIIKYAGYILLAAIIFVVARGFITNEPYVRIVLEVGALASILVPQGLIFAITLFFSYGASLFFEKNLLLQETNATERLGRIKNLCLDKTGTLTENILVVENMQVYQSTNEEYVKQLMSAYIMGTKEDSEIMRAINKFIDSFEFKGEIKDAVSFSSWRQYGGVHMQNKNEDTIALVGSPDIFLPHITNEEEKKWLQNVIEINSHQGKHVLCIVEVKGKVLPKSLSNEELSVVAVFIFYNNLREGIRLTIDFFQNRGVSIRIISGDNGETVRTVASLSGIKNTEKLITGKEMEAWSKEEFDEKAKLYYLFARVLPEQKEKIVEALKKDGFTAMVGDGANDALAIKNADLGVAMFDGTPATRQLASVVLTNNSFTALPGAVELADTIIKNTEMFASIFLNQTILGLFFFIIVSVTGHTFPFTPLNITFINYFAVGMPWFLISYWTIRPKQEFTPMSEGSFLKRIMPFVVWSALIQSIGVGIIYFLSPDYLKAAESNTLVLLAFIIFGLAFFFYAPKVYSEVPKDRKKQILLLVIFEIVLLFIALQIPFVNTFFNLTQLSLSSQTIVEVAVVMIVFCFLQYLLSKWLILRKKKLK